jgi:hypothetical protein
MDNQKNTIMIDTIFSMNIDKVIRFNKKLILIVGMIAGVVLINGCEQESIEDRTELEFNSLLFSSTLVEIEIQAAVATGEQSPNVAENIYDDDLNTRWSAEGSVQEIGVDLGADSTMVDNIKIAWYKGDERTQDFKLWVKSTPSENWQLINTLTSSGTTNQFQEYAINAPARYVKIECNGNSENLWNSISEVEVWGASEQQTSSNNLCFSNMYASDEDGDHIAINVADGDLTTRWSGEGLGTELILNFGHDTPVVDSLKIAWHKGDERIADFKVYGRSSDNSPWYQMLDHSSSGLTNQFESYDLPNDEVSSLKFEGNGNSLNQWNSILELQVVGASDDPVLGQNINWSHWYLSVPIDGGNNKATSIEWDDLENYNLSSQEKDYFSWNCDGSYRMYTRYTGYTTSGHEDLNSGKYCRTEFRERWQGNQTNSDNWAMDSGTHLMESTLQVVKCEGNAQTYVAQIHGYPGGSFSGSPATVKVLWSNGQLILEYYTSPSTSGEEWTSDNIQKPILAQVDKEKFTVKLKVENGVLQCAIVCPAKGIDQSYQTFYDYKSNGYGYDNYFKTGNYFRWNGNYTDYAEVTLYQVITQHN